MIAQYSLVPTETLNRMNSTLERLLSHLDNSTPRPKGMVKAAKFMEVTGMSPNQIANYRIKHAGLKNDGGLSWVSTSAKDAAKPTYMYNLDYWYLLNNN